MAGRFSVEAVFKATDRITAPVSRMANRVGKMTRTMGNGFRRLNKSFEKFSAGVKKGAAITAAGMVLIGGAMAGVIGTGAEFEQTLVSAAAKFPGEIRKGTAAFEQLEAAARKTGATTEFTASQSAEALNFLAMAGFNAEGAIAALPGVVDLATAANLDLAEATDVASDTLGAFGLATKDATQLGKNLARVNDVLAKTATSANTDVAALFEAIKEGGPVATTAGASIETFSALAGELANAGIKGSNAGTTLKNMFLTLAAPTAGAAKVLRRLGIQTKDANGDMLDIVDILGQLTGSLDGLGTAERSGVLEGIFGKIPIAGVNVLLASGSKRLNEYRKQLEGASGASSTMASVMRDTVQGRLNSLKSAVEGVSISIFSMQKGPIADTIEQTTEWVRANEQLIATGIGDFIAKAIPTLKTFAVFLGMIANFIFELGAGLGIAAAKIVIGFEEMTNSAASTVNSMIDKWENFNLFFTDLWGGVVDTVKSSIAKIQPLIDAIKSPFENVSEGISGLTGSVKGFFGVDGGGEAQDQAAPTPSIVSPQERVARSIEEQRSTSTAEVTLKTEQGTQAEVTKGKMGPSLKLQSSGAF